MHTLKTKINFAIIALMTLTVTMQAAVIVNEGSIRQLSYNNSNINESTLSVDYWNFTVNSTGKVTIDVLSWERDPDEWFWVDVNGDGEDSYIDASIYVFKDSLSTENIYAKNDDVRLPLGTQDGTIRGNDSFISQSFEAGNYIIAISSAGYSPYFSAEEAVAGVNQKAIIPYSEGVGDWGDYQITITGDVVPEPTTLCLLVAGAITLAKKRKTV